MQSSMISLLIPPFSSSILTEIDIFYRNYLKIQYCFQYEIIVQLVLLKVSMISVMFIVEYQVVDDHLNFLRNISNEYLKDVKKYTLYLSLTCNIDC